MKVESAPPWNFLDRTMLHIYFRTHVLRNSKVEPSNLGISQPVE